jgi:hypothetical protein
MHVPFFLIQLYLPTYMKKIICKIGNYVDTFRLRISYKHIVGKKKLNLFEPITIFKLTMYCREQ